MKRELKFRAKRVTDGTWAYGGLIVCDDYCIIDNGNEVYVEEEYNFRGDTHFFRLAGAMCDENTIGQFTGLTDKNGKEIYEGDIISNESYKGIVVYKNGSFILDIGKSCGCIYLFCLDSLSVIGNIYDNKELLED